MCNANNHPPNCDCGWGGHSYVGGGSYGSGTYDGSYGSGNGAYGGSSYSSDYRRCNDRYFSTTDSYTNPNAKCPVCGKTVFFYSSENGGRVFFDELGPPWPKHPCTDDDGYVSLVHQEPSNIVFNWQKKGWSPFIIQACNRVKAYIYEVKGKTQDSKCILYIEQTKENEIFLESVNDQCIALFKKKGRSYQLSIANIYGDTTTVSATNYISDIEDRLIRRPSSHVERMTKKKKKKKKKKKIPRIEKSREQKVCKNLAMHLAFSKLNKK